MDLRHIRIILMRVMSTYLVRLSVYRDVSGVDDLIIAKQVDDVEAIRIDNVREVHDDR